MDGQKEQNCIAYFQSNSVWKRLFTGFWEKYRSYGSFTGTVVLRGLNAEEIEGLEGFFGKSFHGKKSVSVSAVRFAKALADSRFSDIPVDTLFELYFHEKPIGKKEEQLRVKQQEEQIFAQLQQQYRKTPAEAMLAEIWERTGGSPKQDLKQRKQQLQLGAEIINRLPYRNDRQMYLAVFATELTGNPHAFDQGTPQGNFLYQLIRMELQKRACLPEPSAVFSSFFRQRCFLAAGILIDDVSNYTMLFQVHAQKKDGSFHAGVEGSFAENDVVQVPLAVLFGWEKIQCVNDRMVIVENPSVFAKLCGKKCPESSCMCMNGQPRLAALMALDLLAASKTAVYYAGDLDPEGLLIAQKIAQYYKGEFHYWHMSVNDYRNSCSKESISEKRLKSLDKITDPRLLPVVKELKTLKRAGYQEKLLDEMQTCF